MNNSETPVGPHTFDKMNDTFGGVDDNDRVTENRTLLIAHCINTKSLIINTLFDKPEEKR